MSLPGKFKVLEINILNPNELHQIYESFFECIKILNFYQLNSSIYMKKFIDLPKNIMNKYIFLKQGRIHTR